MWQGTEKAECRACAAGFPPRHAEHKDMILGSGSLLLCFVGSLLAALCLLTQALCVWRGPGRLGGDEGARWPQHPLPGTAINNSAPEQAPVPSQGDLSGRVAWGMQQEDTAEKDIFTPTRQLLCCQKRKLFNFSGQKGAENWDGKKDRKEIMQIKAHSDISQSYSKKA